MKRCTPKQISTCVYEILPREKFKENGIDPDYRGIAWWKCIKCGHLIKST